MEKNQSYAALQRRVKQLEASENRTKNKLIRFQQFLDAFPFGIYIVNDKYQIEYTNSLLRKEFGDPDGKKCHHYFHHLESPCAWCKNERVFNGETVIWYWHSEKNNRDYELFDLPLENDDGSISKIEIFNDITKRQNLATELERFKLAVEQSVDGICMSDLRGVITYANPVFDHIYGYESGELVGQHIKTLVADEEIFENLIIPEVKSTGQWKGELVQKPKKDSHFYADLSFTIIRENQSPVAMLGIVRDISDLKEKEKALVKSDMLLKETQTLAKIGGWEFDVAAGRISWTDEVYRIYGVAPEQYDPNDIGRDMSFYAPESRPVLEKAFQDALENGTPYDLELKFIRANNEEIWVRTMGRPEKKDNTVTRISGNFIDITDFKRLAQKQERALTLLEKVYESLDEAVFAVDPQRSTILSCNAASESIFGYRKDEMIGEHIQFLHESRKAYRHYAQKLNRALATGTEFHIEIRFRNKEGNVFPTEHIVKAVRDASDLPPIHVMVIKDLTFRKLAEKQLQDHQEELKSRAHRLEELNAALKVLLDQREREKRDLDARLSERLNGLIIPTLNKIRTADLPENQSRHLDILEANIREMTRPVHQDLSSEMMLLSPTESTIADLIKLGYRTKEIASKMSISGRTVEFHRNNIRRKLNIKGRKVNLKTYLSRIS